MGTCRSLPLNNTSEVVVKAVLAAHPEASKEKDKYGCLPLRWPLNTASGVVVKAVLRPQASEKDKYGTCRSTMPFGTARRRRW